MLGDTERKLPDSYTFFVFGVKEDDPSKTKHGNPCWLWTNLIGMCLAAGLGYLDVWIIN